MIVYMIDYSLLIIIILNGGKYYYTHVLRNGNKIISIKFKRSSYHRYYNNII